MSLTNSQYEQIMRQYDKRRQKNLHILMERKERLYHAQPRFRQIEEEIASVSFLHTARMIEGDLNALDELKEKLKALRAERAALFASLSLPEDYLSASYTCADCKDTGYIGTEKCHCFKQATINLIYTQSNIQHVLETENFDHYTFDYYPDDKTDALTGMSPYAAAKASYEAALSFVENFDSRFDNLLLCGNTGVGKTFLSNCIAKALLDSAHSVIYFTAHELFDIFEKHVFDRETDAAPANQHIFECDLLLIDDLGTELTNAFRTSQLFLCINERILRRKSTIISTNLRLKKIADLYSERIFSRIMSAYTILHLCGDDIRIKKKLL